MTIVAAADSAFAWFTAQGGYGTGNLFDTGWVAGYLLIGVAALRPPAPPAAAEPTAVVQSRLAVALPYAPLGLALPFAVSLQLRRQPMGTFLCYVSLCVIVATSAAAGAGLHLRPAGRPEVITELLEAGITLAGPAGVRS